MQDNKSSWQPYNPNFNHDAGTLNDSTQEIRLVNPQDAIDALDKHAALINETVRNLFGGND